MSLLNVKQEKRESLREFMDRINEVCMGIGNLMPEIAMHHLISAIRPSRFTESLIKRSAKNMDELRNRTTKFMQIEEHIDYHRSHIFQGYTPLIVPRGRVLDEAMQTELIPTLKQSQTLRNTDTSKHCHYHRNYSHSTKGWKALKDKIEELIQVGHF